MKYRWIAVFLALLLAGCTAAPASQEASGQQPSGTAAGNDVEIGISADPA